MTEKLFVLVGGVLVALVAGCFSYLNLVVSKEQKVSEFRERWINSLREEIATYVAAMSHLSSTFSLFKRSKKPATPTANERLMFISSNAALYEQVRESATRIVLRINPNDPDAELRALNQRLLELLQESRELFNSNKYGDAKKKCTELRDAAIPVLKVEWNRVRDGEPQYQKAKLVAQRVLWSGLGASLLALLLAITLPVTQPERKVEPASTTNIVVKTDSKPTNAASAP